MTAPPEGFAPHDRKSPVTNAWEPLFARTVGSSVQIGFVLGEQHCNSRGLLHGGVIASLADNAMGLSCAAALGATGGGGLVTVGLGVDYLATASTGQWVVVEPRVIRVGGSLAFADAIVTADGEVIARANATFRVLHRRQGDRG